MRCLDRMNCTSRSVLGMLAAECEGENEEKDWAKEAAVALMQARRTNLNL